MKNMKQLLTPLLKQEQHQGLWASMMVLVGFTFFSPSMTAGGKLVLSMDSSDFFLAVCLGNLFLTVYCGLLAHIGQKTGMSLDILCHRAFGEQGSRLPSTLVLLTQIGWFGVGVSMFAIPAAAALGWPVWLTICATGAVMTATACIGIKALALLGAVAVPCIALLGGYSVLWGIHEVGSVGKIFTAHPEAPMTLATGIGIVIGNFISGGTTTPNFTRFAKTASIAVIATAIAFFLGNITMMFFGAVGGAVTGEADIFNILILQGLTLPAFITLGLNIWTTNNNSLYSAGLGLTNVTRMPVRLLTLLAGMAGTAVSVWVYNNFVLYLSTLSALIPAIGSTLILHYARHKDAYVRDAPVSAFQPAGLFALVAGALAGILLPWGVAPLNALVVSGLVFLAADQHYIQLALARVVIYCRTSRKP